MYIYINESIIYIYIYNIYIYRSIDSLQSLKHLLLVSVGGAAFFSCDLSQKNHPKKRVVPFGRMQWNPEDAAFRASER